ncbi:conjugal transfer protein [Streptomyces sp. N35]|uniref:conjugal transfer protein n=1 Tax=Streptomyces sp. N35 TaxID=2795730 RepID=UPI0018F5D560|nr:conjugal transfer protein [Streptomyces sp. N35]
MSALRKILNLPEKETGPGDPFADALTRRSPGQVDVAAKESGTSRTHSMLPGEWAEEEETSGRKFGRKAGRIVVWGVIGLAAFTGVRTWFFPPDTDTGKSAVDPGVAAAKDDVPELEAQQVAARFARSYLTWSEKTPEVREKELAVDLPTGADPKMGWDGHGNQLVAQTIPGTVVQSGGQRARVRVDVRVSATSKNQTVSSWRGLDVPVAEASGRVIVTGQPALVGLPTPVAFEEKPAPESDADLASKTQSTVKDFLTAWAAGKPGQAAAPGSDISPLASGMRLVGLEEWTVHTGHGDTRTGTASVRWQLAGAQLTQTYAITLTQVSAGDATRWQVTDATAQTN